MQELIAFIRSRQPMTLLIAIVNVIVFIVLSIMGDTQDALFMANHGAAFTPAILELKEYYRLVTCMFLHFGIEHLFYNMLMLIFMGNTLEKIVGKIRFLIIYMVGGVVGNVVSVVFDVIMEDYAVSAGASGAIFAVLGALACAVILNRGKMEEYSGRRFLVMVALSVVQGLTASGIDNCAHIGGLVMGFLLGLLFHRKIRRQVQYEQPRYF